MNGNRIIASLVAAHRPTEREAAKRYRNYATQVRAGQRLDPAAAMPTSAESHDDYLEMMVTLHRDTARMWEWSQIAAAPPPQPTREREAAAQTSLDAYKPTLGERLLGRADTHRQQLATAVANARAADEAVWREVCEQWNWCQQLAQLVLQRDPRAYRAAVEHFAPFEEFEFLGIKVDVHTKQPALAVAFVTLRHHALLPIEYKVLASGRTSPKQMPNTKFRELYQTHVCSAGIRTAREMFSLLPLARVLVHVVEVRLNPATGHSAPETLLSVEFDRERLLNVNFDRIDPPSAVESFRHAMNFKKSVGLLGVDALAPLAQLSSLDEVPGSRRH